MSSNNILHEQYCEQARVVIHVGFRTLNDNRQDIQKIGYSLKGAQNVFRLMTTGRVGGVEGGKES